MMSKNPVLVFALFALLAVGQPSWGQLLRRPQSGVPVQKQQQEPAEATVALALNQPGGQATVETPEVGMATGSKPEQDEPIMASRPIPKRRPTKRPQGYEMDDSDECFDDQDEDQSADYSGMVRFAEEPMRHIGRMMGDIMQRMPMFNYQDASSVMASSSAAFASDGDDDGYYQTSSQVRSPDGRLRGIISETRNGRTKVRRIGDYQDESEE